MYSVALVMINCRTFMASHAISVMFFHVAHALITDSVCSVNLLKDTWMIKIPVHGDELFIHRPVEN